MVTEAEVGARLKVTGKQPEQEEEGQEPPPEPSEGARPCHTVILDL